MLLGLLLTSITGLFFLIGIIFLKYNNKEKMERFTISLAFIVLIGLLLFDLLPEIYETKNILFLIPIFLGFFVLVFLDKLVPHHHHEHHDKNDNLEEHHHHLNHIGIVTIIALAIHNMIEGLSLYTVTLNSIKSGLLMMIGISLHNIPFGFQIGNSLDNKKSNYILVFFLCISSLLGALVFILFGSLDEIIVNTLLSLTFGMLLYILIFELFGEIKSYFKNKETLYGIILGIIILSLTLLL